MGVDGCLGVPWRAPYTVRPASITRPRARPKTLRVRGLRSKGRGWSTTVTVDNSRNGSDEGDLPKGTASGRAGQSTLVQSGRETGATWTTDSVEGGRGFLGAQGLCCDVDGPPGKK